jgi:hypothetical protein
VVRSTLTALAGTFLGAALAALLVWLTSLVLAWRTASETFKIDHWVIYLCVVLGAGFGGVAGAVVGVSGRIASRDK